MRKFIILTVLLFGAYLFAQQTKFYETSFDCKKVSKSSIEYKICTDKELAKLDTILNKTYKSFRLITKEIRQDQRAWIKKRNRCKTKECIKDSYFQRVDELLISLEGQKEFPQDLIDEMAGVETQKLIFLKGILKIQPHTKDELEFKNNLFRFKKFKFIKPILSDVIYDSDSLKELLGECYKYNFYNTTYRNDRADYRYEYPKNDINETIYSVYNITINKKPYIMLKKKWARNKTNRHLFLFNKKECTSYGKKHKFNLIDALNDGIIRKGNIIYGVRYLVRYKGKRFILNAFHSKFFYLYKVFNNKEKDIYKQFVYKPAIDIEFQDQESYDLMTKKHKKNERGVK